MTSVELAAATSTGVPGTVPGVTVHRGLRYARAARFEAPEPVEPRGAIHASVFGPAAPQLPASETVPGDMTPAVMDEDCLFLNVWTPAGAGPHPVVVWFYGGGFLTGATSDPTIDGSHLAQRGPMVVVTVGYRVGALGFLGVGARNCGLLDQECALGWVQRHIAAFGGDPTRVTIAGESAGGGSALHLLAAPRTVGLFRRAIVQSGATDYTRSLDEVGRVTEVVVDALDGEDPRAVPWPRIIEAQGRSLLPLLTEMARMPFHPCVDGDLLPARPADALAAGAGAAVDLLIGTTEDEMRLFLMEPSLVDVQMRKRVDRYLGRDAGDVVAAYRAIVGDDPMDLWAAIFTDREMLLPALAMADAHRGPTYRYLFTWPVAPRADGLPLRACHASDLPFTFDALDRLGWAAWSAADGDRRPAADTLVETMTTAWCRFATTGDPGWPVHESGRVQVLGPECAVVDDPSAARRGRGGGGVSRTFRFPAIDRVVHGPGAVDVVPELVAELGARRVVVVTGRTLATATPLVGALEAALGGRHRATFDRMRAHAPRADIDDVIALVRDVDADLLVGYGGSSVTDATKIIAVRSGDAAIPQVHVPTTLSSGEWTPASGMTGDEPGVKTYVVDPRMAPFAIVLDPEVTLATPSELWLSTGMKAIDHACEAMWGPRAHPVTDTLAAEAIRTLRVALPATAAAPADLGPRQDAQLAGWMSMAGVVNVRVHLSHTLGHQIGARWAVPHGVTSGITLPAVMRHLVAENPAGVAHVAAAFDAADVDRGAVAITELVVALDLPTRLRDVGAYRADFVAVAEATLAAGRATGYVPTGGADTLVALLDQMW